MLIEFGYDITVTVPQPTPVHCLMDVHPDRRADLAMERPFSVTPPVASHLTTDAFGNRMRRIVLQTGESTLSQRSVIEDTGQPDHCRLDAQEIAVQDLPDDVLQFLQGSRYCETDRLSDEAWRLFGGLPKGYQRVQAVCNFVHDHLVFGYAHARPTRTAMEGYEEGKGVCRDFAHLAITFCRCLNIPARYVNGYLGDIGVPEDPNPMDFNAWIEVYLEGGWYVFDARHNMRRIGRIMVARGRDAADIPMLHSFGPHQLNRFNIVTREINAPLPLFEESVVAA